MSRTLVIINPTSGRGRAIAARTRLIDELEPLGPLDVFVTGEKGDAERAASDAVAGGFDRVVAAGGDGTISEVVNGLACSDVELGIVPVGTANVLARDLNLPINDVPRAAAIIRAGSVRRIDLGRVSGVRCQVSDSVGQTLLSAHEPESGVRGQGSDSVGQTPLSAHEPDKSVRPTGSRHPTPDTRYFAAMAGFGFDAAVVSRVAPRVKDVIGPGAYAFAIASELVRQKPARFSLDIDGEKIETEAFMVLVANSASYAYGMKVATRACLDDGRLDVIIFNAAAPAKLALLYQALRVLRSTHLGDPNIRYLTAERVRIESEPQVLGQLDGDVAGGTPAEVEIVPKALKVIT